MKKWVGINILAVLLILGLGLVEISFGGNPFPSNTMLGRWKLTENAGNTAGWLDDSGNSQPLTGSGSPTAVSGNAGGSGDAVQVVSTTSSLAGGSGAGAALNNTDTTVTLAGWIKPVSYGGGGYSLFGRGNVATAGYVFKVSASLLICYMDGNFSISDTTLTTGNWHHVACVYDGTDIRIYLNGVLDDSAPTTKTDAINSYSGSFTVDSSTGDTWNIDDIVVFDEALSAADVLTLATGFGTDFADLSSSGVVSTTLGYQNIIVSLDGVTSTGTGSVLDLGFIKEGFSWRTTTTGSPTSVTILLEGSLDCTNYETLDTSTSTTGEMRHVVNKPVKCLRSNLSVLSGGTSPTVISVIGVKGGN